LRSSEDLDAQLVAVGRLVVDGAGAIDGDLGLGVVHLFHHRHVLVEIDLPGLRVVGRLEVAVGAEDLVGRRLDGALDGVDQDVAGDVLLLGHHVQGHLEGHVVHRFTLWSATAAAAPPRADAC
jgi:hypothetical protein